MNANAFPVIFFNDICHLSQRFQISIYNNCQGKITFLQCVCFIIFPRISFSLASRTHKHDANNKHVFDDPFISILTVKYLDSLKYVSNTPSNMQ